MEKWLIDNKFEFLEGNANVCEETKKILTPVETQSKLLQLMNSDENCDCVRGWVQVCSREYIKSFVMLHKIIIRY